MAFPDDYNYKVDISSDVTKVDSDETDFPYYFDLSNISDSDFWNNVQSDGGDLRVSSDSSGSTQLPLEVVSIDTTGETGEIHFKGDTNSSNGSTYYLWWDDSTGTVSQPASTDTYGRNNVWNSTYNTVLHLPNSGTSTDSSGNSNGLGTIESTDTAGQIGRGRDYSGSQDDDLASSYSTLMNGDNDFSVSVWMNPDNTSDSNVYTLSFRGEREIDLRQDNGNMEWRINTNDVGTVTLSSSAWAHRVLTYDGDSGTNNAEGFTNGNSDGTSSVSSINTDTRNNVLGALENNIAEWNGQLDEFRVADKKLSSGWIGTEYNMQNSNSTFWTVGTVQFLGATTETATVTGINFTSVQATETAVADETANVTAIDFTTVTSSEDKNPISGTVTVDGTQVQDANVWAYNDTQERFIEQVETDSNGDYTIGGDVGDSGDQIIVAVQLDRGGDPPVGDAKSVILL